MQSAESGFDQAAELSEEESDFQKRRHAMHASYVQRQAGMTWWQSWLIPFAGPVLCLLGLAAAPSVVAASSPTFLVGDFFSSSTAALLTIAGIVPAAIGLAIAGRPSLRIDHARVVLRWGPLVNSVLWPLVWFGTSLAALLALIGVWGNKGEDLKVPGAIVLTMSLVVVVWAFFLVANYMVRLTSRSSSWFAIPAAIGPRGADVLKDLRDVALIEAKNGDRRAVRDRMFALCAIALKTSDDERSKAALEELAFLGQEQVLDRDQALDVVHLLCHAALTSTSPSIVETAVKEISSMWSASIRAGASPKIGLDCSYALGMIAERSTRELVGESIDRVLTAVHDRRGLGRTISAGEILENLARVVEVVPQWTPQRYVDALVDHGDPSAPIIARLLERIHNRAGAAPIQGQAHTLIEALSRLIVANATGPRGTTWRPGTSFMRGFLAHGHLDLALQLGWALLTTKAIDMSAEDPRRGILLADLMLVVVDCEDYTLLEDVPGKKISRQFMTALQGPLCERLEAMVTTLLAQGRQMVAKEEDPDGDSDEMAGDDAGGQLTAAGADQQIELTRALAADLDARASYVLRVAHQLWVHGWEADDPDVRGVAVRVVRRVTAFGLMSSLYGDAILAETIQAARYVKEAYRRSEDPGLSDSADLSARKALEAWPALLHLEGPHTFAWCGVLGAAFELTLRDLPSSLQEPEARSDLAVRLASALSQSEGAEDDVTLDKFVDEPRKNWFPMLGLTLGDATAGVFGLFLRLVIGPSPKEDIAAIHARAAEIVEQGQLPDRSRILGNLGRLYAAAVVDHAGTADPASEEDVEELEDLKFAEIDFRLREHGLRSGIEPDERQWEELCALIEEHADLLTTQSKATRRTGKKEDEVLNAVTRCVARGLVAGRPFSPAVCVVAHSAVTDPAPGAQEPAVRLLKAMIRNRPEQLNALASDLDATVHGRGPGQRPLAMRQAVQVAVRIALSLRNNRNVFTESTVQLASLFAETVMEVNSHESVRLNFDPATAASFDFLVKLQDQISGLGRKVDNGRWWQEARRRAKKRLDDSSG